MRRDEGGEGRDGDESDQVRRSRARSKVRSACAYMYTCCLSSLWLEATGYCKLSISSNARMGHHLPCSYAWLTAPRDLA